VGLDGNNCADQVGEKYLEITRSFNGVEIDICDSDWTPGVAEASRPFEPIEYIELSRQPVVESIAVWYDGVAQGSSIWQYDSATNTVYFIPVPNGGVLVEVAYSIVNEDSG
jgi:hypothetical protein